MIQAQVQGTFLPSMLKSCCVPKLIEVSPLQKRLAILEARGTPGEHQDSRETFDDQCLCFEVQRPYYSRSPDSLAFDAQRFLCHEVDLGRYHAPQNTRVHMV